MGISNQHERPTCQMDPDELRGLVRNARARTASLTPEIAIVDPAAPMAIAEGTQESAPIELDDVIDRLPPALVIASGPNALGAMIAFVLVAVVTALDVLLVVA